MPDLNHLWQRFLLAFSLLVGLALGIAATVFGYSNLASVNVHWSIFHIDGIPLWTVPIVPVALILVAGTLYHWIDGLHHFTEHMRHRRRVHELEAEVARLREHLDQVLEMPGRGEPELASGSSRKSLPPADIAAADLAMAGLGAESPGLPDVKAGPAETKVSAKAAPAETKVTVKAARPSQPRRLKKPARAKKARPRVIAAPGPSGGAEAKPAAAAAATPAQGA
jgi:hypothetical protein